MELSMKLFVKIYGTWAYLYKRQSTLETREMPVAFKMSIIQFIFIQF